MPQHEGTTEPQPFSHVPLQMRWSVQIMSDNVWKQKEPTQSHAMPI